MPANRVLCPTEQFPAQQNARQEVLLGKAALPDYLSGVDAVADFVKEE
jgi:hypothetical protein